MGEEEKRKRKRRKRRNIKKYVLNKKIEDIPRKGTLFIRVVLAQTLLWLLTYVNLDQ